MPSLPSSLCKRGPVASTEVGDANSSISPCIALLPEQQAQLRDHIEELSSRKNLLQKTMLERIQGTRNQLDQEKVSLSPPSPSLPSVQGALQ